MRKFILLLLVVTAFGCSKDDVDNTITQKGLLPAPDWLVGTWESEDKTNKLIVKENGEIFMLIGNTNIQVIPKDITKKYYKNNKIFSFFYNPIDTIKIRDDEDNIFNKDTNIFSKWEFKKYLSIR